MPEAVSAHPDGYKTVNYAALYGSEASSPSLGDDFGAVCISVYQYKTDFFAWTREQSALVRARRWSEIDVEHLADEIEDMGKSEIKSLGKPPGNLADVFSEMASTERSAFQQLGRLSIRHSRRSQRNQHG